jgi:hypothetical protein
MGLPAPITRFQELSSGHYSISQSKDTLNFDSKSEIHDNVKLHVQQLQKTFYDVHS